VGERHSIDFNRVSVNIISDAQRRTITLQYEKWPGPPDAIKAILGAISRKFGNAVGDRFRRWLLGENSPFVLAGRSKPHPENPDVHCFEMIVKEGETIDSALACLLGFLRQQPGYQRTFGPPLDPDQLPLQARMAFSGGASEAAAAALEGMLRRRKEEHQAG
jgi:hypothetical protein